jgi:elongator complex protein 3
MELQKSVAEIVSSLIEASKKGADVNLNSLRNEVSRKYKLSSMPRLVDIIAGIPEEV